MNIQFNSKEITDYQKKHITLFLKNLSSLSISEIEEYCVEYCRNRKLYFEVIDKNNYKILKID